MAKWAEDCRYWKTGRSSPDSWLEKSVGLIEQFGGQVLSSGFGAENTTGRAAYMVQFKMRHDVFKIVWPVLPSERGESFPARRQAAMMMYHDIKAKCVAADVLGYRTSFFSFIQLGDGRCAFQLTNEEWVDEIPKMIESQ